MKEHLYRIAICLMFAAATAAAQTSLDNPAEARSAARGGTRSSVEKIEKVDRSLVTYSQQGALDRIAVVLLDAVKEQQEQIDAIMKQNHELQKQVKDLRTEIENLRVLLICRTTMRPELCAEPEE